MPLQLSGFMPADEGLTPLADALIERFESAYAAGDEDPVQIVVVAVINCETVKHKRNPSDHPPVLELRFAGIEPAQGRRAEQLRWILAALKSARAGQPMLDGFDEAVAAMLEGRDDLPPAPTDIVDQLPIEDPPAEGEPDELDTGIPPAHCTVRGCSDPGSHDREGHAAWRMSKRRTDAGDDA